MPSFNPFNLIEIVSVIKKTKQQIIVFVFACVVVATIIVYLLPKYYNSTAVVVAANPALTDKARILNENIQGLYSSYGNNEDLDRMYGIANLDTTFKILVDEFNLVKYYQLQNANTNLNRTKAVLMLKEDIEILKSDVSQLKINVWHKNNITAAAIANRMVSIIEQQQKCIWKNNYLITNKNLNTAIAKMEEQVNSLIDSIKINQANPVKKILFNNTIATLLQQIQQYKKTADEYELAATNNTPTLYILEDAVPSSKPNKPNKIAILITTIIASACFGLLASLVYHQKK